MAGAGETDYRMSGAGMDDFEQAINSLMEACRKKFETAAADIIGVNDFGEDTLLADDNAKAVKDIVDNELAHLEQKIRDIKEATSASHEVVKNTDKNLHTMFDDFQNRNKPNGTGTAV